MLVQVWAVPKRWSTHISNYQSNERESYEHDETSMTENPVCPRERFTSYKTLFRLVPCYKRDWATCFTVATTCYLLLFASYVSPRYTITCYRYFQCLQLLPCWKPFIRAFYSLLGSTLLLIERTTIDPLYLWVIRAHKPPRRDQGVGHAWQACGLLVAPLWYFFRPVFFINSKIIPRWFSRLWELCE